MIYPANVAFWQAWATGLVMKSTVGLQFGFHQFNSSCHSHQFVSLSDGAKDIVSHWFVLAIAFVHPVTETVAQIAFILDALPRHVTTLRPSPFSSAIC